MIVSKISRVDSDALKRMVYYLRGAVAASEAARTKVLHMQIDDLFRTATDNDRGDGVNVAQAVLYDRLKDVDEWQDDIFRLIDNITYEEEATRP